MQTVLEPCEKGRVGGVKVLTKGCIEPCAPELTYDVKTAETEGKYCTVTTSVHCAVRVGKAVV